MVHHINTLEKTLDMSMESLEENERSDTVSELVQVKDIEDDGIKPRWREKLNRSLSSNTEASSNNDFETASGLLSKVSALIDRLEKKVVSLQPFDEEVITQGKKATVLVVSYTVEYASEKMNEFRSVVQDYVKRTQSQSDCYHIGIRSVADTSIITIYEVWRDEISWDKYWCTNSLQSLAGDLLAKSHQVQKMDIPDSWWPFAVMD
jgi:quinol monooxygenase YgiN